jgi:DNA-binding NtrC family response regulator
VLGRGTVHPEHLSLGMEAGPARAQAGEAPAPRSLKQRADAAAARAEREAIQEALQAARGNKSEAARTLGIDYKTLHLKMRRYAISADHFRAN